MSVYTNSNVAIHGGSSTFVAGNLNHIERHGREGESAAFEKLCQHVVSDARHNSGQVSAQPKCHPGTRVAILTFLLWWASSVEYAYPIVWLHGPAGSGKSTILRTVAELLFQERLLFGSFFFFRRAERGNTAEYIIPTIAYQLALAIPETRQFIEKAIKRDPTVFRLSLWDQAKALIISPLSAVLRDSSIDPSQLPRIIIIDGLDECKDTEKQQEILRVLGRIVQTMPITLAVLIASRPEHIIREEFDLGDISNYSSNLALDRLSDTYLDIKRYLVDRFNALRQRRDMQVFRNTLWPGYQVIDQLVAKASGQFIYVATVDTFISSLRDNPAKRLDIILGNLVSEGSRPFEPLDNLYSAILHAIVQEHLTVALRILSFLLLPLNRTPDLSGYPGALDKNLNTRSPALIERLLNLDSGDVARFLFDLESLLTVGGLEDDIRFSHASLADYFFDRSRSGSFHIDVGSACADIAEHCIQHLMDWPELHHFFLQNCSFLLSKAEPTAQLCLAIQNLDLKHSINMSTYSSCRWLRHVGPTFLQLQASIGTLPFPHGHELFEEQFRMLKEIAIPEFQSIYLNDISVKTFVVCCALGSVCILDLGMLLVPVDREYEDRFLGLGLCRAYIEKHPAIIPIIQGLLNDEDTGCSLDIDQYADVALHLFEK